MELSKLSKMYRRNEDFGFTLLNSIANSCEIISDEQYTKNSYCSYYEQKEIAIEMFVNAAEKNLKGEVGDEEFNQIECLFKRYLLDYTLASAYENAQCILKEKEKEKDK